MNLEASLIVDTSIGVQWIQTKLASFHMELQDLNKGKELRSEMWLEVWCIK